MTRATRQLTSRLAATLVGVLLLAGCGADDPPSGDVADVAADGAAADDEPADREPVGDDQTWELRFANFLGPDAAQIVAMQWWADEVEARTDGRVTVEFFHGGSLLDATDTLPGIGDGRAEMGHVAHFYHPAELPLSRVSEIPFLVANSEVQARAFNDLYRTHDEFRTEWEAMGVHLLHVNPSGVIILGSGERIAGPEELTGVQVRAVGGAAAALDAKGANPIAMDAPEIYESLQRGLIDAYSSFPFEVITAFQLQEVAPYIADPGLGNYLITAAPINLAVWESMPPDVQQILEEVSADLFDGPVWEIYTNVDDAVCDAILDVGGEVSVFDEADVQAWQDELGGGSVDTWLAEVGDRVTDAEGFLQEYLDLIEHYSQDDVAPTGPVSCAGRS